MIDFLMISTRSTKNGIEIYPKFIIPTKAPSSDLMIRGGDFYAVWDEDKQMWSEKEEDALRLIDRELDIYVEKNKDKFDRVRILHMWDSESGMIDKWHKYCQKQLRDSFHMLDESLIFSNTPTNRASYASKKLDYPLEPGDISAWDKILSVLYSPEERHKIEWAIGSVISGDSKKLQKFMVFYGSAGTGKSTVINIIQKLFDGYYSVFDAKALGSSNNSFALEAFKSNPLVAIQHDGDLSRIEDNTRLNSLVSHEVMTVNEKFKSAYANRFKCFLFMGTNKPVKITDSRSGLIRRLIDVTPTGNKIPVREYNKLINQIDFELGAIASHCLEVYKDNKNYYDDYIPLRMLNASNDFFNYVLESYDIFKKDDGVSLKVAWEMYNTYCAEAKVGFPLSKRLFTEELRNYFRDFKDRVEIDGKRIRSYYCGFKTEKLEGDKNDKNEEKKELEDDEWLQFNKTESKFDDIFADCKAQYATADGLPKAKWENVSSTLKELNTKRLHYIQMPEEYVTADFDIPDENGEKCLAKNIEAARMWPPTYGELSKSGGGIHLVYKYVGGNIDEIANLYAPHVEIKKCTGNSAIRRKLTYCNGLDISTIGSGLPKKKKKGEKVLDNERFRTEKALRNSIEACLQKKIIPYTAPSVGLILQDLDKAYASGLKYDVSDMRNAVYAFACGSHNQADKCMKMVNKMKFKSYEPFEDKVPLDIDLNKLVFFDLEVAPNVNLLCYKFRGPDKKVVKIFNPSPSEIEVFIKNPIVGFNCRRYDNHILYGKLIGYDAEKTFNLSNKIINTGTGFFGEAYNLSYTDIYDFASAGNKKSLKKLEIEMGIHHSEFPLPWDQPIPEEMWDKLAEYCANDVLATEAAFDYLKGDWTARQILADLAGGTVNDTTNSLTTKFIFGDNKHPQDEFNYRFMGCEIDDWPQDDDEDYPYDVFDEKGRPEFPGYVFQDGKSYYRGEEVGEGGYVYAEPGMYGNVALLDIASMHPSSIVAENLFGDRYTARFKEIMDARLAIKHEDWATAESMLDGKLAPYIQKVKDGEMTSKELADALKTAINSVYGLTSAKFDNPFRDRRNIDNIVAKRGALFMINLKHEVKKKGYTVAHIKTDSIKIPDATPQIIEFVMEYGKKYGYTFEHEDTYEKMCLVNDAVYIARYKEPHKDKYWTATGAQFAVPYVFKKLFSHEDIVFSDMCETKSVSKGAMYLDMNEGYSDVSAAEAELDKVEKALKELHGSDWKTKLDILANTSADQLEAIPAKDIEYSNTLVRQYWNISKIVESGHNYIFVGRVGSFCPMQEGYGGGWLVREKDGKYYAVTGTKGYRWMESEMVRQLSKEDEIETFYYDQLVDEAIKTISQYGDFEWFASDEPYIQRDEMPEDDFMNVPEGIDDEVPFD